MHVTIEEISMLKGFIEQLNSESESVVIVEGKRDSEALKDLGYRAQILEFHKFGGMARFVDSVCRYKNLVILFDSDRKGRYLTRRVIEQLDRRTRIDLSHKKRLIKITNGKIRTIEELIQYVPFVNETSLTASQLIA